MSFYDDMMRVGNKKKEFKLRKMSKSNIDPVTGKDYAESMSVSKGIAKKAAEKKIEKGLVPKELLYSPMDFTEGVRDESGPIPEGADFFKSGGYRDSKGLLRDKAGTLMDETSALTGTQEAGLVVASQLTKGMGSGGSSAGGAVEGAASGAMMGFSVGGPPGAVVGAVAGGVMGIMGASSKRRAARKKGLAEAALGKEKALSTARQSFAANMGNILMGRDYR